MKHTFNQVTGKIMFKMLYKYRFKNMFLKEALIQYSTMI